MTPIEKVNMVKEAIRDWNNGTLSDKSALLAIDLVVNEQRKPSKKVGKIAAQLAQEYGLRYNKVIRSK